MSGGWDCLNRLTGEQIAVNPRARQVALQREPIAYCLEEADNGPDLAKVYLKENAAFRIGAAPSTRRLCAHSRITASMTSGM